MNGIVSIGVQFKAVKSRRNARPDRDIVPALIFCLCIIFTSAVTRAQTRGKLEIVKDARIDTLIAHRYSADKSQAKTGNTLSASGYRVQFFTGPSRKEAFSSQNMFQQLYPELRTYITYREPDFKVKGGDFRTRLEAARLMQELKGKFMSLFVIAEKINLPKLDTAIPQ